jgi:hypothetical protein
MDQILFLVPLPLLAEVVVAEQTITMDQMVVQAEALQVQELAEQVIRPQ